MFVGKGPERRAGFIDEAGRWVIPPKYDDAYHFCGGLAPLKVRGRWGFIDSTGHAIIATKYEGAESFDGSIAIVYEKDEKGVLHRELIDRKGTVLYRSSKTAVIIRF